MIVDPPYIVQARAVLSTDEFVRLAEELGGTRVYIPKQVQAEHDLAVAIGLDAAQRLSAVLPSEWLPVPLAKRERALYYEAKGLKDHQIARKVGMTRSGVQKLLDREAGLSDRDERSNNPAQLRLF